MLRRILWLLTAFPAAALLITLAVANRHSVRLVLDPFRPETPVLSIVMPFYGFLFGALLIGVLIGGAATWLSQGRWRRVARVRAVEAKRWRSEADRLMRERDAEVSARNKALAAPDKRNAA
ncbi:hypothetical protein [Hyphomicrobium sp. CS1GBMeth3]|uniref:hypothetical protein n=1 Tax=Hyphomicrobium sp. CS1GBMeth3 TaxID=1892845 RepID=UPI000931D78F|nr:hypothetical protein [Hyphomicrobium sp. CS1GBMeth3]